MVHGIRNPVGEKLKFIDNLSCRAAECRATRRCGRPTARSAPKRKYSINSLSKASDISSPILLILVGQVLQLTPSEALVLL